MPEPLSRPQALLGDRPAQDPAVRTLNPRCRTPVSLIIDDSTCLVNLAHYCIPQFAEVFPDRYTQDWRALPREVPDAFVREFGEWCHENGVKGKYSIVPYPACVGWVDREMPGWTKRELEQSLELVRTVIAPDWDVHPEMVSHTWVIDPRTGRSHLERSARFMENWDWTSGRSLDEMTEYLAYALGILKNAGLECEGITTPGGFGNQILPELAQSTLQSCRSVYSAEIPHYFRHVFTDGRSVAPRVEYASGLGGPDPRCVVSIIGCTGDWFGGWDGLSPGSVDRLITADLQGGRLPEVIARGEPAVLVCHWPGIYFNGERVGFRIFQEAVRRLHARYDDLVWMKLSDISRYWAARELTTIERQPGGWRLRAPFAAPDFTLELPGPARSVTVSAGADSAPLREVRRKLDLVAGTWLNEDDYVIACFDLPRGDAGVRIGTM
ncbi:MAG TPA: hypothetical protein VKT77_15205 [Chthonomonadaceae bacterium]|nr:hypothetical protein [Chthonomonadaceae bacterium]